MGKLSSLAPKNPTSDKISKEYFTLAEVNALFSPSNFYTKELFQ